MISRRLIARSVAERIVAGEASAKVMRQLAAYVVEHRLQKQIGMILKDVEAELAARGVVTAEVTTATKLPAEAYAMIEKYIQSSTGASDVQTTTRIDPDLIGGVVIRTPGKTVDTSVATQLKRLRTT